MIQSCIRASNGVILFSGSHSRQRLMKSRKVSDWHIRISAKGFVPGILKLFYEFLVKYGSPVT